MKKKISNKISDRKKFNHQQKKKKKNSNANTTKANRISDSKKFNQKKKKSVQEESIVEMDIAAHSQGSIFSQQDVIREILSWLPVRSLFRFKCVAKSWDITFDPYFRMNHQSHHKKGEVNSIRFLLVHTKFVKTGNIHSLYSTSFLSSPDDVRNIDYLSSHNNPFFHILCGSCDGLVLIRLSTSSTHSLLLLWNPLTRQSIQLPFPIFGIQDSAFGFGYDPTTHDYKILTIHKNNLHIKCGILALKSGSWRNVYMETPQIFRTLSDRMGFVDPLAFVHGAFHWIACSYCVISFNISNEVYTKIPLTEQMYSYLSLSIWDHHVSVLDGMLCFSSAREVDGAYIFTLWAMKDYGVKESWTQLFKIKTAPLRVAKPIYRFADGDVLFHCRDSVSDSLRTSKGRFRLWCDSLVKRGGMVEIFTFNESLIDPKTLI